MNEFIKKESVGPLVSSQEQRAPLVPEINRLSTGCQPVVEFLYCFFRFPDMPCTKGFTETTKGDGPLVSSHEQRALVVPQINRLPTGYQPLVNRSLCSFVGLHRISLVRASGGNVQETWLRSRCLGGYEGRSSDDRPRAGYGYLRNRLNSGTGFSQEKA